MAVVFPGTPVQMPGSISSPPDTRGINIYVTTTCTRDIYDIYIYIYQYIYI